MAVRSTRSRRAERTTSCATATLAAAVAGARQARFPRPLAIIRNRGSARSAACARVPARRVVCLGSTMRGGVSLERVLRRRRRIRRLSTRFREVSLRRRAVITPRHDGQAEGRAHTSARRLQAHRFASNCASRRTTRLHHYRSSGRRASRCRSAALRGGRAAARARDLRADAALAMIERERAPHSTRGPTSRARWGAPERREPRPLEPREARFPSPVARLAWCRRTCTDTGVVRLSETLRSAAGFPRIRRRERKACKACRGRHVDSHRRPASGAPLPAAPRARSREADADARLYKVAPELVFDARGTSTPRTAVDRRGRPALERAPVENDQTGGANVAPMRSRSCSRPSGATARYPSGCRDTPLGEAIVLCGENGGRRGREESLRAGCASGWRPTRCPARAVLRAEELAYTGNQKIQVEPLKQRRCGGCAKSAPRSRDIASSPTFSAVLKEDCGRDPESHRSISSIPAR